MAASNPNTSSAANNSNLIAILSGLVNKVETLLIE